MSNTRTRLDHSNCDHPRTPAGRAACRKARKKDVIVPGADVQPGSIAEADLVIAREKALRTPKVVRRTVQAAGSKVVHLMTPEVDGHQVVSFACTKVLAKDNATLGVVSDDNPVTCKNCLKID